MNKKSLLQYLTKLWLSIRIPLIAIAVGFLVGGVIITITGKNPLTTISGMIRGGFLTDKAIASTLNRSTPIIFAGLAAALAWGSGYPSLGAQGQMIIGALTAAIIAATFPGPAWLGVLLAILGAMIVGMLYSLLGAFITANFHAYLLIVTLMMNYIADYSAKYLTTYIFRDPNAADNLAVQTAKIENAILPRILSNYVVHYGFVIAVIAVIAVNFMMKHTSFGYKARMNGLNPSFAEYGGVESKMTMYKMLMISGALAGLGGAVEVLGSKFRYIDAMITSPGFSWSGVVASIMSNYSAVGTFVSSIFLAGIAIGGSSIEVSMGVASEITTIIEGVITMLITAQFLIQHSKKKRLRKVVDQK